MGWNVARTLRRRHDARQVGRRSGARGHPWHSDRGLAQLAWQLARIYVVGRENLHRLCVIQRDRRLKGLDRLVLTSKVRLRVTSFV